MELLWYVRDYGRTAEGISRDMKNFAAANMSPYSSRITADCFEAKAAGFSVSRMRSAGVINPIANPPSDTRQNLDSAKGKMDDVPVGNRFREHRIDADYNLSRIPIVIFWASSH